MKRTNNSPTTNLMGAIPAGLDQRCHRSSDSGSCFLVRLHIEGSVRTGRDVADQDTAGLNSSSSLFWTVASSLSASLCLSSWWEVLTRCRSWSVGFPPTRPPPPPQDFGSKLFLLRAASVLHGRWPEEIEDLGCPFSRAWRDAFQRAASNHGSCPFTWHQFWTEPEVCPLGRRIIFYVLTFLSAMTVITKHTRRVFFSLSLSVFPLPVFIWPLNSFPRESSTSLKLWHVALRHDGEGRKKSVPVKQSCLWCRDPVRGA